MPLHTAVHAGGVSTHEKLARVERRRYTLSAAEFRRASQLPFPPPRAAPTGVFTRYVWGGTTCSADTPRSAERTHWEYVSRATISHPVIPRSFSAFRSNKHEYKAFIGLKVERRVRRTMGPAGTPSTEDEWNWDR